MTQILTAVFGFIAGLFGGMGMGGGTVLIPLMSFLDVPQHTVQAINLISFLPMSIAALYIHGKNGLLKPDGIGWIVFFAVITAIIGAVVGHNTDAEDLRHWFGVLLLLYGVAQAITVIASRNKRPVNGSQHET